MFKKAVGFVVKAAAVASCAAAVILVVGFAVALG
jgi:hypothetical protein